MRVQIYISLSILVLSVLSLVFICASPFSIKYVVYFHVLICYLYSFFEIGNQSFFFAFMLLSSLFSCYWVLRVLFIEILCQLFDLQIFLPICFISFIFLNTVLQKLEILILINLSTYLFIMIFKRYCPVVVFYFIYAFIFDHIMQLAIS